MGKKISGRKSPITRPRAHSIHNNLKSKLGSLIRIIDFNSDKPDILEAKLWNFKTDFYAWLAALPEEETQWLKTNDYYYCIVSRIGE